jgi:large subunit ribosomal protein L2
MGKRIIVQRRGRGSNTYKANKTAYKYEIKVPKNLEGQTGKVVKLISSPAHSAPIAKISYSKGSFYIPAFKGMFEGQQIEFEGTKLEKGNIMKLKNVPVKTEVYCIESRPKDGGKFIKTAGSYATVSRIIGEQVFITMPSKKEKGFNKDCRVVIGIIAGAGRKEKPIVKAGKKHYMMKSRNKLWPRTSAVKMNKIDHPFGCGRGKNPKSKIAKRNAPAGKKVGLLRPRRTGKRK